VTPKKNLPTSRRPRAKSSPTRARARDWKPVFLRALREERSVTAACLRAGIDRTAAYRHRRDDAEFAEAWRGVDTAITDDLEREAIRRAVDGVEEPEFYKGEIVGSTRRYSDSLLQFLLKGRRREVYGDRTELTGADGGPIQLQAIASLADAAMRREVEVGDGAA
jgi:hypothetical protein